MRERDNAGRPGQQHGASVPGGKAAAEVSADAPDLQLLGACQQALVADPALAGCVIGSGEFQDQERRRILGTEGLEGRITVEVKAGVVVLDGEVPSLGHKRLAGVLARRSTGCRAVVNRISVILAEEDSDHERETAVRLALSRDPALNDGQSAIRVRVRGATVILEGTVDSPMKALAAESDASSVFGVERVDNRLEVDPRVRGKA